MQNTGIRRLSTASWCLYDWANSAFNTVIITFVYSVFFSRGIAGDETAGSVYWSYAVSVSGFIVALTAPLLGSAADYYGARKGWVGILTVVTIISTAAMFLVPPEAGFGWIIAALLLVIIANTAFELAIVFYNAMLPALASAGMIGRISGWAWGTGYFGGLACLAATLFLLVGIGDMQPLLPVSQENAVNVRLSALLVAGWMALFSLPLFLWTEDVPRRGPGFIKSVRLGLYNLKDMLLSVSGNRNLLLFLAASALYRDGLNTLFVVGGLFAAGVFGMDFQEILVFAIAMNVSAGLGALAFSFLDDRAGSKKTVIIALSGLILCGIAVLTVRDKAVFMMLAVLLGIFVGPVQSASRALAGRLAPLNMEARTYGLYAFTGKSIAFLGPLAYGAATQYFGSQIAGMATILFFWLGGTALLLKVKEESGCRI